MTYDAIGRLIGWTAPSGTTATDSFLYDGEGNRVLQSVSSTVNGTTTVADTINFDGYTETTLSGGTTTTLKYYSLNGQRLAVRQGSNAIAYLISDLLGSTSVAVSASGSIVAAELYWPYGEVGFHWGTMPTTYNFTGQRRDSETGLLYFNFRYFDPFSGRFTRADTVETNASGMDPYAYVGDDPVGRTDPTGHKARHPSAVEDEKGAMRVKPQTLATTRNLLRSGTGFATMCRVRKRANACEGRGDSKHRPSPQMPLV